MVSRIRKADDLGSLIAARWAHAAAVMVLPAALQVDRYKQLLLKQRDIMIALTARLNERDEQILTLQEELEAYDVHQKCGRGQRHFSLNVCSHVSATRCALVMEDVMHDGSC